MICIDAEDTFEYKKWLMLTRKLLQLTSSQDLEEARTATALAMLEHTQRLMGEVSHLRFQQRAAEQLVQIFEFAFDILNLLHFHPATFAVEMAHAWSGHDGSPLKLFNRQSMEDIAGSSDEELTGACLSGSVFPAIFKIKDEDGKRIDAVAICKARVRVATNEQLSEMDRFAGR